MLRTERAPTGIPPGRWSRIALVVLAILLIYQLVRMVQLIFFVEDQWMYGDYMIDQVGHTSIPDVVFRLVVLLILLALVDFRRKYRFIVLAVITLWVRVAILAGTWRYFLTTVDNVGMNLHLINEVPWRYAVIAGAVLPCLATTLFIVALLSGEHVEDLYHDWIGYLPRKLGKET